MIFALVLICKIGSSETYAWLDNLCEQQLMIAMHLEM